MTDKKEVKKLSVQDKERQLLDKIEKAKKDLAQLQDKRKLEIGELAYKHKLHYLSDADLDHAFAKIAKS